MDEKLKVYDDKMTKTINNLGSELAAILPVGPYRRRQELGVFCCAIGIRTK